METAIAKTVTTELVLNPKDGEKMKLLADTICKGATPMQLDLFVSAANRYGLDPFLRQIHAVIRGGKDGPAMTIQVGIDGFRTLAERTGKYNGQGQTEWCGPDGHWMDVWLQKEPPRAARCTVYRKGWDHPVVAIATYEEYKQTKFDGGVNAMWGKMPALMLGKCAEALALRKAFPSELSGLYAPEEIQNSPMQEAPAPRPAPRAAAGPLKDANPAPRAVPKQRPPYQPFEEEAEALVKAHCEFSGITTADWLKSYAPGVKWASLNFVNVVADMKAMLDAPAFDQTTPAADPDTGEIEPG